MSVIEQAYAEVRLVRDINDDDGCHGEARLLDQLAGVMDYAGRIFRVQNSSHYRLERAGNLVEAALRLRREAAEARAGNRLDDATSDALYDLSALAIEAESVIGALLWARAEHTPVTAEQRMALRRLVALLEKAGERTARTTSVPV